MKSDSWILLFFFAIAPVLAPGQQNYSFSDIGTLGGPASDAAGGINTQGQVAGAAYTASGQMHAYVYDPAKAAMTDIGTLGAAPSRANGLNNSGQVVGRSSTAGGNNHAFLYQITGGKLIDLHSAITATGVSSTALSTNDQGQIVGSFVTQAGNTHAFLYNISTGTANDLYSATTLGGGNSTAFGINNSAQIVGAADDAGGTFHVFVYSVTTGKSQSIPLTAGTQDSLAMAISDNGLITGITTLANGSIQGFQVASTSGATPVIFGNLSGGANSLAFGLNSGGQVVGAADTTSGGDTVAVIYSASGPQNLNGYLAAGSPWQLLQASGINASGWIAGYGFNSSTYAVHAFVMKPATAGQPTATLVSNASSQAPIAPGSLVSIYPGAGTVLSNASQLLASTIPLPTTLGGTTVTINGTAAPLLYVDKNQINAQVPVNVLPGQATVVVSGGGTGATSTVSIAAVAPGLFAVAAHGDGSPVSSASPANANEYITLYGTGQGPVNAAQTAGTPTPDAVCTDKASVSINGQNAGGQYFFCGMSYFVGVTQINAQVPSGLSAGNLPVVFVVNGVSSNSINIAVSGH